MSCLGSNRSRRALPRRARTVKSRRFATKTPGRYPSATPHWPSRHDTPHAAFRRKRPRPEPNSDRIRSARFPGQRVVSSTSGRVANGSSLDLGRLSATRFYRKGARESRPEKYVFLDRPRYFGALSEIALRPPAGSLIVKRRARQPGRERLWKPPIPRSQKAHRGRYEQCADDGRIEKNSQRNAQSKRFDQDDIS
jgi:hypothetical protein